MKPEEKERINKLVEEKFPHGDPKEAIKFLKDLELKKQQKIKNVKN